VACCACTGLRPLGVPSLSTPRAARFLTGPLPRTATPRLPPRQKLAAAGALGNTAVFAAPSDADSGTKLATLMAAAAAGERVRDEGGHSLVGGAGGGGPR
jgi:hypothetical protein